MRGEKQVSIFSAAMLEKLQARAHHGDWKNLDLQTLLAWLRREMEEFHGALWGHIEHGQPGENVLFEAADVAILLMFLCDNYGVLTHENLNCIASERGK